MLKLSCIIAYTWKTQTLVHVDVTGAIYSVMSWILWGINIFLGLSTGVSYLQHCLKYEHIPVCLWAYALLIHASPDRMRTSLHIMNTEVRLRWAESLAEWRRGQRSSSGVSCVEISCLSGPVTVYDIISGDGGEMTFLFQCCHLTVAWCAAGLRLLYFTVSNSVPDVVG